MGNTGRICHEPKTIKCSNEYEQCNGQYYVSIKQDQACFNRWGCVVGGGGFPHKLLTACCLLVLQS